MLLLEIIILIPVVFFLLFIILAFVRSYQMQHSAEQKLFLSGTIPDPLPQGFKKGRVNRYAGPWIGKRFDAMRKRGVNVFLGRNENVEQFNFHTSVAPALRDTGVTVFKIEYNILENSPFLRMVLDEIVETENHMYLGKIHIRLIPKFPFTVGFFYLEK